MNPPQQSELCLGQPKICDCQGGAKAVPWQLKAAVLGELLANLGVMVRSFGSPRD